MPINAKTNDWQATEEMQKINYIFGDNIRIERLRRGFTIEDVSFITNISASYLGALERGVRTPSIDVLFIFCNIYGLTPNELLTQRNNA